MNKIYINLIFLLAFCATITAQDFTNVLAVRKLETRKTKAKNASQLYNDKGFMKYVDQNKVDLENGELDVVMLRKIANSYRMNADYVNAENWYVKFVNQNSIKEDILHYAQSLQANGRCKDAVRWFEVYKSKSGASSQTDFDFRAFATHRCRYPSLQQ